MVAEYIFWISIVAAFYAYVGYPILVIIISLFIRNIVKKGPFEPKVTVLITAYNEENDIGKKIENTLELDYRDDLKEIIVASDGSTDATDEIVKSYSNHNVILHRVEGRLGKTATQNSAVKLCTGKIIIFSDAASIYKKDAIRKIIRNYFDPAVGAVSGRYKYIDRSDGTVGKGTIVFWEYENFIKKLQAKIGTLTGACGCIYSIRKDLYTPLPDEIISDLVEPLTVLRKGFKIAFEPEALAYEKTTKNREQEFNMRVRVITRGMCGLIYVRDLLNPLRYPYVSLQLISHKIARWLMPFYMIGIFVSNIILIGVSDFYLAAIICQILFYSVALFGFILNYRLTRFKILNLPVYFCIVNMASFLSIIHILYGKKYNTWETVRN